MLEHATAEACVFGLRDRVFGVSFFEAIERNDDAVDFSERVKQISVCAGIWQLDFLSVTSFSEIEVLWLVLARHTSSMFIVADSGVYA